MEGMEGEAVVYHRETRYNASDAVRSARPEGKRCLHLVQKSFSIGSVGSFYELVRLAD
jgi:hypothetical protein